MMNALVSTTLAAGPEALIGDLTESLRLSASRAEMKADEWARIDSPRGVVMLGSNGREVVVRRAGEEWSLPFGVRSVGGATPASRRRVVIGLSADERGGRFLAKVVQEIRRRSSATIVSALADSGDALKTIDVHEAFVDLDGAETRRLLSLARGYVLASPAATFFDEALARASGSSLVTAAAVAWNVDDAVDTALAVRDDHADESAYEGIVSLLRSCLTIE